MKINSMDLSSMSNKQVKNIYLKAFIGEIDEKELVRIREALYELTPLCQFTKEEYSSLLETLDSLSDEALKNIERGVFSCYYRRGLKSTAGMPEDFEKCDSLVNAIYTDYRTIDTFPRYMLMNEYMLDLYKYTDFSNQEVVNFLSLMNPELCNLLVETRKVEMESIFAKLSEMDYSTRVAYLGVVQQLLTTYMMFIDEYQDSYSVPSTILSFMVDNFTGEQIQSISMGMKLKHNNIYYAKELLDYYYKLAKANSESFGK